MRKRLGHMADRIEAVLALHKVQARVTGGTVTPRWVRFQVLPTVGASLSPIKELGDELAAALDVPNCRVSRRGAAVAIEVVRDDPQPVQLLPLFRQLQDGDPSTSSGWAPSTSSGRAPLASSGQAPSASSRQAPSAGSGQATSAPSTALRTGSLSAGGGIALATAVLGLAEDGAPLLIRLPSPDVGHVLVAGTVGAGKTVLLQTMALSLAMANPAPSSSNGSERVGVALVLIDLQGQAFGAFEGPSTELRTGPSTSSGRGLPHLARPVIREVGEATEALQSLLRLMEQRADDDCSTSASCRNGQALGQVPHIVLIIDRLADLLAGGGVGAQQALARLTQRGREAGIHVIAAIETPTAAVLGPVFPVRLVGRVTGIGDARAATGRSGTGAERLLGRGDFLAVADGRVIRFQGAHVSRKEIREVVAHVARGGWSQPGWQTVAGRQMLPSHRKTSAGGVVP